MSISENQRIKDLNWRLERLETFLGKAEKKQIGEKIIDLNDEVSRYASQNSNARNLIYKSDQIQHLTGSDFQRSLLADRSTKLELILADEERIRQMTKNLTEIEQLAKVLDENSLGEIPRLYGSLHQLLVGHHSLKNEYDEFNEELTQFLQDYAAFTIGMDENLHQYKTLLSKKAEEPAD